MFELGLVSVTFRKLSPIQILDLMKESGLRAIEWGSDVHVPPNDPEYAAHIGKLTREAGIRVASYGSYYRPGVHSPQEFEPYLQAALALGAPVIRVWAGDKGSADASPQDRDAVISCTQAICDMAAEHNITICYEYHGGTLTDRIDSAMDVIHAIHRPNMKLYWQYNPTLSLAENCAALEQVLPHLQTVHAFSMDAALVRHPLTDVAQDWQAYRAILETSPADHPVLLEFVEGDLPESFLRDAKTLTEFFPEPTSKRRMNMTRHEIALEILRRGTVIPATTLALNDDGSFNEARQRLLIRYYLEAGAGGIATAVHSTQFEIRKPEFNLFERVISIVTDEIDRYEAETGKVILKVCGVCGPAEQAVREAKLAKSLGFDAVLVSPGGLAHLTEDEMLDRARQVADVLPIIGFYLQTAVGGRVFSYDFWCELAKIPNLKAIKCASFNRYTTLDVMRAISLSGRDDEIALYTGNDDNIVVDLLTNYRFTVDGKTYTNRFRGGLLGHWSVWTRKVVELFEELRSASATDDYLTLAAEITDCNAVFFDAANAFKGCIPGIHEILRRQGLVKSVRCLNPDEVLSPGQAEEIDRVYAMYPHLNDDAFVADFLARHPITE